MLFDDAQSYTTFKLSCRLSQSVTSPTTEYSLVSSAISEIIIKNRRGPKMVPCGTPLNTNNAIVQNEMCQLGSETTKYQYFQLSQLL